MSNSSTPDFRTPPRSLGYGGLLDEISFPVYLLAHTRQPYHLYSQYSTHTVTLNYMYYPSEYPGAPILLSITSTSESADVWPVMHIQYNQAMADGLMDYVRTTLPDTFPGRSAPDEIAEIEFGTVVFYRRIQDGTLSAQTEDHQSKSGLRFQIQHLQWPFSFARAYARNNADDVHLVVMTAGYSRAERLAILDLLAPARGAAALRKHMNDYWPRAR